MNAANQCHRRGRAGVPSTTQVVWRLSGCGRGSENTDSQHLLAEQQDAPCTLNRIRQVRREVFAELLEGMWAVWRNFAL